MNGQSGHADWRSSPRAWTWITLALIAYFPALASSPGRMPADSKLYVYLNPGRFFGDAATTFDPRQFGGWVPHQHMSYLWPTDPWFWVFDRLGVPDWIAHRLWIGTLLFAAGSGVWWLARRTLNLPAAGALVAAVAYQTSVYILPYISRTSVMLLPWAGLGWIIALTARSLDRRGWRNPALLALVVFTVGAVNATALALIVPGPVLWIVHAVRRRLATWADVWRVVWRTGLLVTGVSLWWIVMLGIQGRYGADVLAYSETLADVSYTSTAPEVLRSLGYWLFYIRNYFGPATTSSLRYLVVPSAIVLSFGVTIVALAGLAFTRWAHRTFALGLVAVGAILAVGVHPIDNQSPLFRLLTGGGDGGLALALRSSTRALPLMVLGLSLGLASLVSAARAWSWSPGSSRSSGSSSSVRWRVRGDVVTAAMAIVIVLANNPTLVRARLVDPAIDRDEDPPSAWVEAGEAIDAARAEGRAGRVLQLPGVEFGAFRWGYTVDQPLPSLTEAGLITRDLLPLGSPSTMDLLYALDDRVQDGVLEPDSVAPVARLLGADTIWLTNDVEYERFGTTRPQRLSPVLDAAPGLSEATMYGSVQAPRTAVPMVQPDTLARPDAPIEPVALYTVSEPRPLDSVTDTLVALSGSGAGVVDAAGAGLLDGSQPVVYTATMFDGGAGLDPPVAFDRLIVTDSNRDQARQWRSSQDSLGFTETGGARQDVLRPIASDRRLDLFATSDSATQTVAIQEGPLRADATAYGEPFSYLPEHRPFMAIDGDLSTSWIVGDHGDPIGELLQLRFSQPLTSDTTLSFVQAGRPDDRLITEATVTVYSPEGHLIGSWPVAFTAESRSSAGQQIEIPGDTATVTIKIDAVDEGIPFTASAVAGVGFAEISGPFEPTREVVRVPTDGVEALDAGTSTDPARLDYVFTRWRVDQFDRFRSDPEPTLYRQFDVPKRTLEPKLTVRVDPRATDAELSALFDLPVAASGHLLGSTASSAGAAFDANPATTWITPFDQAVGSSLSFTSDQPTGELSVSQPLSGFSRVTEVVVAVGDQQRTVTVTPNANGTAALVIDPPLPAGETTVTISNVDPLDTIDRRFGDPTTVPAAITDLSGPSIPVVAGSDRWSIETDCVPVATIGTTAVTARLTFEAGQSFDDPLTAVSCESGIELSGTQRLATADDLPAGLQLDRVVLAESSTTRAAPSLPMPVERDGDVEHHQVSVESCSTGCWLIDDVAANTAWTATDGETELSALPLAGSGQAWWLPPAPEPRQVTIAWTLQRRFNLALLISLVAVAACLVLALRRSATGTDNVATMARPTATMPRWASRATMLGPIDRAEVARRGVATVAIAALLAGILVQPLWAVAGAAVAGVSLIVGRRLIVLTAITIISVVGFMVAQDVRTTFVPPDGGWPHHFESLHPVAMFAIALIAIAAVRPANGD